MYKYKLYIIHQHLFYKVCIRVLRNIKIISSCHEKLTRCAFLTIIDRPFNTITRSHHHRCFCYKPRV